ncbi:MAG TPA: hypothetical protein VFA95_06830 [Gammaproteobacteria bacterium]|nr:hypothetical protein [Gammaproteobacteria bacterium]
MASLPTRGRVGQRQRRMLEFALVVIVIGLVVAVLIDRVQKVMVEAERASVVEVVGQLRAALGMQVAKLVAEGDTRRLARLQGGNPMQLMARPPASYAGTVTGPDSNLKPGHWYYDPKTHALRYRVRRPDVFVTPAKPADEIRYRVVLVYRDSNGNGRYDGPPDQAYRVELKPENAYHWIIKGGKGGQE